MLAGAGALLALALAVDPAPAAPPATALDANGPSCRTGPDVLRAWGLSSASSDLARMAMDVGAAPLRPDLFRRATGESTPLCTGGASLPANEGRTEPAAGNGPALLFTPVTFDLYGNTTYPFGGNDGAVWQGRDLSAQIGAGLAFRWGVLSASVAPTLASQQNGYYPILPTPGGGDLAYASAIYGAALDSPQRFGGTAFWTLAPGQSFVQVDHAGFGLGFSTENLWWGPGMRSSILMTDEGPGIPHLYAGTVRPVDVWIGNLEADLWAGRISRSKYFATQDPAWLFAVTGDLELRWVRGLYLGAAASGVRSAGDAPGTASNLVALYVRWVFPSIGLEAYGEWSGASAYSGYPGTALAAGRASGYTVGVQEVFTLRDSWLRVRGEAAGNAIAWPWDGGDGARPAFYAHPGNTGYTSGGQMIGAASGPVASSQVLDVDLVSPSGWFGATLQHVRRNEGMWPVNPAADASWHDDELAAGLRYRYQLGPVDLGALVAVSYRAKRDFVADEWNGHFGLNVTLWPEGVIAGEVARPAAPR